MSLIQDFESLAREKLVGFTRGEWLLGKIRQYLEQPEGSPFLLITGEPGIGKSAFSAYLWRVQKIPHAVHFCVGGRGGTLDFHSFVESVSQQLLLTIAGFKDALDEVQISVFGPKNYQVNQHFYGSVNNSQITGISIRDFLPSAKAFDLRIRRPLQILAKLGKLKTIVVLVDGLDESLTPASGHRNEEFVDNLSQAGDLPAQVRFIFTSKPDPFVVSHFSQAELVAIDADGAQQQEDVRAFLRQKFEVQPGLREASEKADLNQESFVVELAAATEFNFLYLTLVLPQISERKDLRQVRQWPSTLDKYYHHLLETRIGSDAWEKWGAELTQVILAVQEPASLTQIAGWVQWDRASTRQRLSKFSQLMDPGLLRQDLYWRHHWSFVTFVLDEKRAGFFLCDAREGHNLIADYYLSEWGGLDQGLPMLPTSQASDSYDNYPHGHLCSHLCLASEERRKDLFALVDNRLWLEAQQRFDPSGASYTGDLFEAWKAAEEYDSRSVSQGVDAGLIGREVRCALAIASLRAGIPAPLLTALVKNRIWNVQDALSAARNSPNSSGKARALLVLAPLSGSSKRQVIEEARKTVDVIYEPWEQASIRGELAGHLPHADRRIFLEETFDWVMKINSEWKFAETLASLAPHLPDDLAARSLNVIWSRLKGPDNRLKLLLALAPRLPVALLREALDDLASCSGEYAAAILVIRLLYLTEGLREDTPSWDDALTQATSLPDEAWQVRLLGVLVPGLPAPLLNRAQAIAWRLPRYQQDEVFVPMASRRASAGDFDDALALAKSVWIPWRQVQALTAIAGYLPSSRVLEALEAARSIGYPYWRAEALAELVDFLPQSKREHVLRDALAGLTHGDKDHQAGAIAAFAPYLPMDALPKVFATVERMRDESLKTSALEVLAPNLPENLVESAFDSARSLKEVRYETRALIALIPRLPASLMLRALDAVGSIGDATASAKLLAALAPHIPDWLLPRALKLTEWIQDIDERAEVFAALAPRLSESQLREVLNAVRSMQVGNPRARALAALIPCSPHNERSSLLLEALEAVGSEWFVTDRVRAGLVECLTQMGEHSAALKHANSFSMSDVSLRIKAVEILARHLPEELLNHAFAIAERTPTWEGYVQALMTLNSRLAGRPFREMLDKIPNIAAPADRVYLLAPMIPFLDNEERLPILRSALDFALEISDLKERERALIRIAQNVRGSLTDKAVAKIVYSLWREILHSVLLHPDRKREDLLNRIGALAPILAALGGADAVLETVHAIQEVGDWWK